MASNEVGNEPVILLDDEDIDSILANIAPGPTVLIRSLEGDTHAAKVGDIVQVVSSSGGFQGTLAYVRCFTDTGRLSVVMPSNHQIRTYMAKNIRFLCREEDEFGINFHQRHNTCRWQHMLMNQEQEADLQSEDSGMAFPEDPVQQPDGTLHGSSILQGTFSGAVSATPKEHWVLTAVGAVCGIMWYPKYQLQHICHSLTSKCQNPK